MNYLQEAELEIMLDLWLVSHGGRQACLHAVYPDISQAVFDYAKELGLKWTCIPGKPYPGREEVQYVVALFFQNPILEEHKWDDQEHLRTILGYSYGKVDFQSPENASWNPSISAVVEGWKTYNTPVLLQLFSYHGMPDPRVYKSSKRRLRWWRRILREHPFPGAERVGLILTMSYDDGRAERRKRADDWVYVQKHYDAYVHDLHPSECTQDELAGFRIPPTTEEEWRARRDLWVRVINKS